MEKAEGQVLKNCKLWSWAGRGVKLSNENKEEEEKPGQCIRGQGMSTGWEVTSSGSLELGRPHTFLAECGFLHIPSVSSISLSYKVVYFKRAHLHLPLHIPTHNLSIAYL